MGRALINGTKGGMDMDIFSNSTRRMLKIGAKKDLTHHTVFLLWVFCHGWKNEAELFLSIFKVSHAAIILRCYSHALIH